MLAHFREAAEPVQSPTSPIVRWARPKTYLDNPRYVLGDRPVPCGAVPRVHARRLQRGVAQGGRGG